MAVSFRTQQRLLAGVLLGGIHAHHSTVLEADAVTLRGG